MKPNSRPAAWSDSKILEIFSVIQELLSNCFTFLPWLAETVSAGLLSSLIFTWHKASERITQLFAELLNLAVQLMI